LDTDKVFQNIERLFAMGRRENFYGEMAHELDDFLLVCINSDWFTENQLNQFHRYRFELKFFAEFTKIFFNNTEF
jgi:hypothetical protein